MADEQNGEQHGVDDMAADVQAAYTEVSTAQPTEPIEPAAPPEPVKEPATPPPPVKEPAKEPTADERARDEQGRFAKKPDDKQPELKLEGQPAEAQLAAVKSGPPLSWSIAAKREWEKLPPLLQEAIAKREAETNDGFKPYEGLKPYIQYARQNGKSLPEALQAYVTIEDTFRRDEDAGFFTIMHNLGKSHHEAAQKFAHLAMRLGYQGFAAGNQNASAGSPDAQTSGADPNLQQLLSPVLSPLEQRLATFEQQQAQLRQELDRRSEAEKSQRLNGAQSVVEQFRQDPAHRYYDDLEEEIGNLLKSGMVTWTGNPAADLAAAYEKACWLHPEVRTALVKEQTVKDAEAQRAREKAEADKKRAASRSVSGSPAPGSSVQSRANGADRKSYDDDLYEDVRAAARSVGSNV